MSELEPSSTQPDRSAGPANREGPVAGEASGASAHASAEAPPSSDGAMEARPGTDSATSIAKHHRMARLIRWGEEKARSTLASLEAARPRSKTVDTAFRAVQRDADAGGGVLAAAVAFRVFLLLAPYVLLIVLTFGAADSVAQLAPGTFAQRAGIGGIAARSMADAAKLTGTSRLIAFVVTLLAVLIGARTLLKALGIVHVLVWRVPIARRTPRPKAVLIFLAAVTGAVVLAGAVDWLRHRSPVLALLAIILYGVIPAMLWLVLAYFLPHPDGMKWTAFWPGAVLFGVGAEALHVFTVYWIAHAVSTKSDRYGAIGVALAILLWAYVFGRIFIAAAVVTATAWFGSHPEDRSEVRPGPADMGLGP